MATCKEPAEMSRSVRIIHGSTAAAALQASRIATKVETCIKDGTQICLYVHMDGQGVLCSRIRLSLSLGINMSRHSRGRAVNWVAIGSSGKVLFSHERYDDTCNSIEYPQLRDLQLCTRPRRAMHIGWRQIVRQPEHPVSFNARCVVLPSRFRPVVP